MVGSLVAGLIAFRLAVFDPNHAAFQCVTIGMVTAAVFALLRSGRRGQAVAVVSVFAVLRLGLVQAEGWLVGLSGVAFGGGILAVAIVFDLLARRGIVFGKFAIAGAMLGGVFLAVAPMVEIAEPLSRPVTYLLLQSIFLGVIIGDGVGLGVEIADAVGAAVGRARAVAE